MDSGIGFEWLALIPLVAGFIGWVTNWLAIKMIFHPQQWIGLKIGSLKFGWQGIIHRKAQGFAKAVGKQVSENMLQVDDLMPQVSDKHANAFIDRFPALWKEIESGQFLPDLMGEHWDKLSGLQKQMMQMQIKFDSRSLLLELVKVARTKFVERFDLRGVISRRLSKDSHLLAQLYGNLAKPELRMIEVYGFVFGALIGAVEAVLFTFVEMSWSIFIFGILIGAITNWLAIEMIFRPRLPVKVMGIEFQGLFSKRQDDIADQFALIGENQVLPIDAFVEEILAVLEQDDFIQDMEQTSRRWLHRIVSNYQEQFPSDVSVDYVVDKAVELFYEKQSSMKVEATDEIKEVIGEDYRVAEIIRDNLSQLSKEKFERVLRVVFEEDETTLILIGAAIGLMISGMQFMVFS